MTFGRGTANTVTIHPLFYPPCPLLKHNLHPGVIFSKAKLSWFLANDLATTIIIIIIIIIN